MDNARRAKTFEKAVEICGTGNEKEILVDLLTNADDAGACKESCVRNAVWV
jgi:hypothetical protein